MKRILEQATLTKNIKATQLLMADVVKMLLGLIALFILLGCANTGAKFNVGGIENAPMDKAVVYFYRPSRLLFAAASFSVIANNISIGTLDNGAYFKQTLSPGTYKVYSDLGGRIDRPAIFAFEAGKTYFVRLYFDIGTMFVQVHEDEALPEIQKTEIQL